MKKPLFIAGICLLSILAGCTSTSSVPTQTTPTTQQNTSTVSPAKQAIPVVKPTPTPTPTPTGYTLKDVQKHNTANDCRTVINGKIYNMSSFSSRHSGGADSILSVCGKDGTAVYAQQHNGTALIQQYFVANLQK